MDTIHKERLFKFISILVVVLIVLGALRIVKDIKSLPYVGRDVANTNVITVNGEGEAFAVPDIASLTFSVSQDDKTVSEAQKKMTARINPILEKLKKLGIAEKDIQTADYSVYPKYEYSNAVCSNYYCPPSRQDLVGYTVTQTIAIKIRKVEDSGKILGEIGGSNVTTVSGLNFTVDDEDAVVREAREKAIASAKAKAEQLAKDLGVRLGRVTSFSESGYQPPYFLKASMSGMGGGMMEDAAPSIPAGQNKITSNVTITYEIK